MNPFQSFGFVGGGRVSHFLLKALAQKKSLPSKIIISDPNPEVLKKVQKISPDSIEISAENKAAAGAEIVFLSLHPPVIKDVLPAIKEVLPANSIFISLAPVVSIEKLSAMLGGFNRIVRMIPNAPSIVHKGYNPVVFAPAISKAEKTALLHLFEIWGEAPEVAEKNLEAYAIVAAMGPTYFWPQWVQLEKLGQKFGLSQDELKKIMPAMLNGAVEVLYNSGLPTAEATDLIPVYPMKPHEENILNLMDTTLTGLHQKLTGGK